MLSGLNLGALTKRYSDCSVKRGQKDIVSVLSSLGVFAPKHLHKCKNTYLILQNKYLCIYEDSLGAKILGDDCALSFSLFVLIGTFLPNYLCTMYIHR